VLRTGSSRTSERVVLYVAPGAGPPRAAWVTGKRVGGAVARNRARRLLRETWRSLAPRVREGHELVFVARGPFGDVRAPELTEEIEDLLRGIGVMRS
jgi:ribonuclease P protein component